MGAFAGFSLENRRLFTENLIQSWASLENETTFFFSIIIIWKNELMQIWGG